jgi:gamma-glutamylcyclotransferase (GGCT)/AIG2-like uncharacterized protein YtfP
MAQGKLLDLGSYPGMILGDMISADQWILGEIWTLHEEHIDETLAQLDRVEGYDPRTDSGLYIRRVIRVWATDSHEPISGHAHVYLIADAQRIACARPMLPSVMIHGRWAAQWPDGLSRVPSSLEDE